MHSTQKSDTSRKRPSKPRAKKGQVNGDTLISPAFQEKVERLDKLMKLAVTPQAPPGFVLMKKDGEGGTLEQVGREADNAWAGVKRIMSLLNVESKVLDYQVQFTASYGGNVLNLVSIAQGVQDNQRTGDSLRVQRLRTRFWINWATANTPVTIVIGRSKDGIPAIGDVFETFTNGYAAIDYENHDQRKADVHLRRRIIRSDNVSHPVQIVEFDMKCPDLATTYSNATTTCTANAYWAAVICGVASGPTVTMNSRLDFVDN